MFAGARIVSVDMRADHDPAIWRERLADVDAVINCIGVLSGPHSQAVHVDGPKALHSACEQVGVRRLLHMSAISANDLAGTDYAKDKLAAEGDLRGRDLDWVILRPSLVYAESSHGGTSALRGLAGFPGLVPVPGRGDQPFSPIHVEDLARTVLALLESAAPKQVVLEPCGPEVLSLREIVLAWRNWLGVPSAPVLAVPMPVVRGMARVIDRFGGGPLSSTAVRQMEIGNAGDGGKFAEAIGFAPDSMRRWLTRRPASVQDKWHARIYFLRPLARYLLAVTWILSGVIGLFAAKTFVAESLEPFGAAALAGAVKWLTCLLDLVIGAALLARWQPWRLLAIQALVVVGYTLALTIGQPGLWGDPLGPLLKNGVFLVLAAFVAALEDDR